MISFAGFVDFGWKLGNYFGAEESGELTAFVGAIHAGEQDVA